MLPRVDERLSAATGLLASAAVGAGSFFGHWPGDVGSRPVWWIAYGIFVVTFTVDSGLVGPAPRPSTSRVLLAVEVVAATGAWLVAPRAGWTAILFVVTAASGAFVLSRGAAISLVGIQTAVVAAGTAVAGGETGDVVVTTVLYGAFQAFACLVVLGARRESEGRVALAAAHAELRAASALLATTARDAERVRIARELHDVVGHQLTALALELEVASHQVSGPATEHVGRAREVAKNLLADVRAAVGDLRTEAQGLESALREAVGDPPGLDVQVTVAEDSRVEPDTALVLVRCVQELVTNALRHAGARTLTLDVRADADGVTLSARDDGRGAGRFVPGNGLTGMTERVTSLGGAIELDPGPGRGFGALVRVPA